jgi:predicted HicB family RNase H-like nuclease
MDPKPKIKRLTLEVPEKLHSKIKIEAIFVGISLRQYVIRAVLEKIHRDKINRE